MLFTLLMSMLWITPWASAAARDEINASRTACPDLQRQSVGHQIKPRAHRFLPPARGRVSCQDQECSLEAVLGIVLVVQDTLTALQNHGTMTAHERGKSGFIAFLGKSP